MQDIQQRAKAPSVGGSTASAHKDREERPPAEQDIYQEGFNRIAEIVRGAFHDATTKPEKAAIDTGASPQAEPSSGNAPDEAQAGIQEPILDAVRLGSTAAALQRTLDAVNKVVNIERLDSNSGTTGPIEEPREPEPRPDLSKKEKAKAAKQKSKEERQSLKREKGRIKEENKWAKKENKTRKREKEGREGKEKYRVKRKDFGGRAGKNHATFSDSLPHLPTLIASAAAEDGPAGPSQPVGGGDGASSPPESFPSTNSCSHKWAIPSPSFHYSARMPWAPRSGPCENS